MRDELYQAGRRGLMCLGLKTRTVNVLIRAGFFGPNDLLSPTPESFLKVPGFGKSMLNEVRGRLDERGTPMRKDIKFTQDGRQICTEE